MATPAQGSGDLSAMYTAHDAKHLHLTDDRPHHPTTAIDPANM